MVMAAKKKSSGKKRKKGGAKKARSKHIPLSVLKRRLVKLSNIVKSRGG
jgi:hypothetical protein